MERDYYKLINTKYTQTYHYLGFLYTRVFIHPKQRVGDVNSFVRVDILRSITGRFRIYRSGYKPPQGFPKPNYNNVHMPPPRRCYFKPFGRSLINLCDFEFEGIGFQAVEYNAKLLFGLTLKKIELHIEAEIRKCV